MFEEFPIWVIVIDYVLGTIMWTLAGRFGMSVFLRENSTFFFMQFFVRVTNPLLRLFAPITPAFLIQPIVPLYVAWFFFHVSVLRHALVARIFSDGHAVLSSGK